ncbi:N-terminal kinase-like protein [Sparganum proliferum]
MSKRSRATGDSATTAQKAEGFYSAQELAGKVLPCLSFLTVDAEKEIRDIALRTLRGMLERLEKASEDPAFGEPDLAVVGKEGSASNQQGAVGILKSGTSAAGGLLGNWALSALTSFSSRLTTQSVAPQKPAAVTSTPAGDSSVPSDQRPDSTASEQPSPSRNEPKTDDRSKDLFKDDAEDEYDKWGSLEDLDLSESPSTANKTLPKAGTPAISDWDTSDWADEKPKENSKREDRGIESKRRSESPSSMAVLSSNKASPKAPKVTTSGLNSVNSSRKNSEDTEGWNVGKGNDFFGKSSSSAALKLPAKVATPIASTDWTADWTNTQSVPAKNSGFTDNPDRFFDEFLPTTAQKPANKPSLLSPSSKKAASRPVPTPKLQPASKRQDPGDDDWGAW